MRRPPMVAVATPGIWLAQASLSLPTRRSRLPCRAPQRRLPWSSHAHPPNMAFSDRPRVLPRLDLTSSSRPWSRGMIFLRRTDRLLSNLFPDAVSLGCCSSLTLLYVVLRCLISYYVAIPLLYVAIRCYTLLYVAIRCCTLLYVVVRCYTLLYVAIRCCTLLYWKRAGRLSKSWSWTPQFAKNARHPRKSE